MLVSDSSVPLTASCRTLSCPRRRAVSLRPTRRHARKKRFSLVNFRSQHLVCLCVSVCVCSPFGSLATGPGPMAPVPVEVKQMEREGVQDMIRQFDVFDAVATGAGPTAG